MQAELVDRARSGDREAFGVLAAGAVDRLYGIARLVLRDTELAEDATQDALVRAWRDLPTLRDVDRFDAWLYRLIVRSCADIGRHRRRWRAEVTILSQEPSAPDGTSSLADRELIERGLRRLTIPQQTILVLTFYLDLPPSEVAEALDIPVGTAKSRLHYALEARSRVGRRRWPPNYPCPMDEQTVRDHARAMCDAIVAGDVETAIADASPELRRNLGEVIGLFPLPATEAAIESITQGGSSYVVVLRMVGETDEVQVQTRWKDRDGSPTLVEASHLSRTERAAEEPLEAEGENGDGDGPA